MQPQRIFCLEIDGHQQVMRLKGRDFLIVIIFDAVRFYQLHRPGGTGLVGVALAGPTFGPKHSFCQELYYFLKH